jgi:hypothetical protein
MKLNFLITLMPEVSLYRILDLFIYRFLNVNFLNFKMPEKEERRVALITSVYHLALKKKKKRRRRSYGDLRVKMKKKRFLKYKMASNRGLIVLGIYTKCIDVKSWNSSYHSKPGSITDEQEVSGARRYNSNHWVLTKSTYREKPHLAASLPQKTPATELSTLQ